jgi:hypothetical protein
MKLKRLVLIGVILAIGSACTSIKKTNADGSGWKYSSVLNRKSIQEMSVTENGGIKVKGYLSTQAENLKAVAEGVTEGAIKGAKGGVP